MLNWFRSIMNSGSVLGYFFQAVPITCFVGIVYLIIRVVTVKRNKAYKVEWLEVNNEAAFLPLSYGINQPRGLTCKLLVELFDGIFLGCVG
ncbi:MAG: hypothetical protein ACLTZI_07555 [[Eubacterium] siraeum]